MTTAPFLSDLTKVRSRTRKHTAEGSPDAGSAASRVTVLRLLNDILASELIWLMRYRPRFARWGGRIGISDARASAESSSADRLARRIVELGGEPDLDPDQLLSRNCADYASSGSATDRISEDLLAERMLIESYAEVIDYLGAADPSTRAMLESNLSRERTRTAQLSQILRELEMQALDEVG